MAMWRCICGGLRAGRGEGGYEGETAPIERFGQADSHSLRARMWSGVVPQQPPIMRAPCWLHPLAYSRYCCGCMGLGGVGGPALRGKWAYAPNVPCQLLLTMSKPGPVSSTGVCIMNTAATPLRLMAVQGVLQGLAAVPVVYAEVEAVAVSDK